MWRASVQLIVAFSAASACSSDTVTSPANDQPPLVLPKVVATTLSVGEHQCVIRDDGEAFCWGGDFGGRLGTGGSPRASDPRNVSGGLRFQSIRAGYVHTCALTAAGAAYCWGFNRESDRTRGMIGDGTDLNRNAPSAVVGGLTFRILEPGGHHTCGVTTGGQTYCWGTNANGELGSGDVSQTAQLSPVPAAEGLVFDSLSLGYQFSCGLTSTGAAYCWGSNGSGQLGSGTLDARSVVPAVVAGDIVFRSISASIFRRHTCGLAVDSTAYCWGQKWDGPIERSPVAVPGGTKFIAVTAGANHACGLTADRRAHCWGYNFAGQLGDGTLTNRTTPAAVLDNIAFRMIEAGIDHTCGLTDQGIVYCWGNNETRPAKAPDF